MPKVKEAYGCQVIDRLSAKVWLTMSPVSPQNYPMECIIGTDIFRLWQNPHIDNPMYDGWKGQMQVNRDAPVMENSE